MACVSPTINVTSNKNAHMMINKERKNYYLSLY